MTYEEANREARKVFDEWALESIEIEKKARESGQWKESCLDGNRHLFKEVNQKAKDKLEQIRAMVDED